MATSKRRVNVTLSPTVDAALRKLADRDNMPESAKALELIQRALEFEEDELFNTIASTRDTKNSKFVSHADAWV